MSRNREQWAQKPNLPTTHYSDPLIYSDPDIFEEEKEKIFKKTWLLASHESELPNPHDFRTYDHPAGPKLVIVRGEDMKIRTFLNVCPHRGNVLVYEPSGNSKNLVCIFHQWAFNGKGDCVDIPREKEGYQDRVCKKDVALREVRTETAFGGFVWVNLDDNCVPLKEYIAGALDYMLPELETERLETMWYYQGTINTNWKLIHDTNSEFYHDYLHYHNRITGMMDPKTGYWTRKLKTFANGHAQVGTMEASYEQYQGGGHSKLGWPNLPAGWKLVDLYPCITFNLRNSVLRIDTYIPVAPNKMRFEFRAMGLKNDTPEIRRQRQKDGAVIWSPFGRNLHEDLIASSGQTMGMAKGSEKMYFLAAREEGAGCQDEVALRHYFTEWDKRMGRSHNDPMAKPAAAKAPAGTPAPADAPVPA